MAQLSSASSTPPSSSDVAAAKKKRKENQFGIFPNLANSVCFDRSIISIKC
jgi:hypothetical protein